ncbi:helix-turn-helix domain-containing protein [Lysobacter sp. TAF61]|uniref:helix-turn-helix domain-containing protein n=1 Tax=Lysobacter sp. TAF61 TaxID=3233072 RepID=UPI003F97A69E
MPAHEYETRHGAGDTLRTHRHDGAYAALVLDGSHVEASADGPVECTPGTLVLHPRWHAHGNRFGRTGAKVINLELGGDFAVGAGGLALRVLRVADLVEAGAVFARAHHHLDDLLRACTPAQAPALHDWQPAFLHELEHGDLPVSVLARRAGVSLAHASRSFLRSHGMPPQLLRRELRCRQALALLGGEAPLAEVAAAAGFSDQSHLNRTLRLATGTTPGRLRGQIKSVQDRSAVLRLQ